MTSQLQGIQSLKEEWEKLLEKLEKEFEERKEEYENIQFGEESIDMDIERLYGYIDCLLRRINDLERLLK